MSNELLLPKHWKIKSEPRGWFISTRASGGWYLHHDGLVKPGVISSCGNNAFWDTLECAKSFLNAWRQKHDKQLFLT